MKNSTGTLAAMRMRGLAATLPLAAFALAFAPTVFADIVAGDGEMAAISVATGTQTESGPVMLSQQSDGLEKTGGGEYVLPISSFAQQDAVEVAVREGAFTLSDTGATAVAVPAPACLTQKAALWLDAAQNTIIENDLVTKWLDVREGATDNGAYYCAGGGVSPATATSDGKTWVDFGGYGSGKWLSLQNASRSSLSLSSVYHAYAVLIPSSSGIGQLFGVSSGLTFHPGSFSDLTKPYWNKIEGGPALYSGMTHLNGVWIDGTAVAIESGSQLLEWAAGNETATIGNFFNDRNVSGRQGGGLLGEVALFTNRLDSAERMAVEQYLLRKWRGEIRPASYSVKTASGTTAAFDGLSQEEFDKVAVTGLGKAEKRGVGTLAWRDAGREPFGGAWRIAQGAMAFESGETPLAFADGDALTVAKDDYGVASYTYSSGTAGSVSLSGGGAVRISSLPAATTAFTVSADALSIASTNASAVGAVAAGAEVFATIPNAGFEAWTSQQTGLSGTKNNWTFSTESGIEFQIFRNNGSNWNSYINGWNAPEGENVLAVKAKNTANATGTASVSVSVPVAGRYEFMCKTFARNFSQSCVPLEFSLAKDGTSTRFARIQSAHATGYQLQRFVTPALSAGEYTLTISASNFNTSERWAYIDDLTLRLIRDTSDETVFAVPNGDFELATMTANAFSTVNTAQGWTFSNPSGGDPDAGIAWRGTAGLVKSGVTATNRFNAASATRGNIQLAFFGAAGAATSDAFALPAGKWRLRLRAGRWGQNSGSYAWNGKKASQYPALSVTATVGGSPVSLGSTGTIDNNVFKSFSFPTVIESDGTTQVALALTQTTTHSTAVAGLLVDDLEFVRDDNLVANGNFEDASGSNSDNGTNGGWLLAFNRGNGSNVAKAELVSPISVASWGKTTCEGSRALHIVDCGAASRSVSFPEAGLYRISLRARARADYSSGDLPNMHYAGNSVKALLDGAEIYRTPAIGTTNFVYYSGIFRVAAAGSKTFTLQGCAASGDKNAFVDLVSIEKTDVGDVPDIAAATEIEATLTDGAKLRLDYPGTLELTRLRVNGKNLWNEISAETYPNYIAGPGKAFTKPFSTVIYMR